MGQLGTPRPTPAAMDLDSPTPGAASNPSLPAGATPLDISPNGRRVSGAEQAYRRELNGVRVRGGHPAPRSNAHGTAAFVRTQTTTVAEYGDLCRASS